MTSNEIIKALESLLDKMRAYESKQTSIGKGLVKNIISMYNRQKAEIERLKEENENLRDSLVKKKFKDEMFEMTLGEYKAEAIKEFAERLKANHITKDDKGKIHLLIEYDEFDNLVKEMTEQKE